MPRPRKSIPSYLHHKARNLAFVRVPDGVGGRRTIYLGRYDSPESHAEYRRVLAELQTRPGPASPPSPRPTSPVVNEVIVAFVRWALAHYRDHRGRPTHEVNEIRRSLGPVRRLFGHIPAAEFGPRALAAVRNDMIATRWCRTLVNRRVERVKRAFRWAASEELVPVGVHLALRTLPGLRKGRTEARESEPVGPADPAAVAAALPFLSRHVRAMVELQRYTGMRPGEACGLTLGEVDRSGEVWLYRPSKHKTAHRGKGRVIPIGPKARAVLTEFLAGVALGPDDPVFSPVREREERFAARRAVRKSRVQPSQANRRKPDPKRVPSAEYTAHAYAHAVARACEKSGAGHFHPNQLRHLFATEVRRAHGLEAAGAVLGHSKMSATQVYAKRDEAIAIRVAESMG